jgi:hypothetical protein
VSQFDQLAPTLMRRSTRCAANAVPRVVAIACCRELCRVVRKSAALRHVKSLSTQQIWLHCIAPPG